MANDDYSKETIVEVSTTTSVEVMAERLAYFMGYRGKHEVYREAVRQMYARNLPVIKDEQAK